MLLTAKANPELRNSYALRALDLAANDSEAFALLGEITAVDTRHRSSETSAVLGMTWATRTPDYAWEQVVTLQSPKLVDEYRVSRRIGTTWRTPRKRQLVPLGRPFKTSAHTPHRRYPHKHAHPRGLQTKSNMISQADPLRLVNCP